MNSDRGLPKLRVGAPVLLPAVFWGDGRPGDVLGFSINGLSISDETVRRVFRFHCSFAIDMFKLS